MRDLALIDVLARVLLAGELTREQIVARGSQALGRNWRWLGPLAQRFIETTDGKTRPRHRDAVQFILHDAGFVRACSEHSHKLSIAHRLTDRQHMQPVAAARAWDVPAIESAGALADWLWLDQGEMEWFADLKGLAGRRVSAPVAHYHYRILAKERGSFRLIEAPKPRLKKLQREILAGILENVPPHPASHGFLKGRSIKTFAAPHAGQRAVLRMDLQNFFPSFSGSRVQALFRTMGYPESVADLLGGICTNAAPGEVWKGVPRDADRAQLQEVRALYSRPHLPQGAPTSPALASLCAFRMDCRLLGLARCVDAVYTRYADDLAFSGSEIFERRVERFAEHVAAIVVEEGFVVNHRKTRIMRQGVRQHLAGLTINQHLNVMRPDFDRLKATLTNCGRLGPQSQNRDDHPAFRMHLEGRVGFVEMVNPDRGKRLRVILERIEWQ